jgi:hypothetical protein
VDPIRDRRFRAPAGTAALALLAAASALTPCGPAAAEDQSPVPDRIEDVPSTRIDPFPEFDNFAWRAFVVLNWPSLSDPAHCGLADRARALGDPGPRVWEMFKARYELFQFWDGRTPGRASPWATYEG